MHAFQQFPIEQLEINPFEKIGKEWALVSAGSKKKANTMTISWGGVGVLWGKNVAFIFIRDSRYTKEFIDANDFFSVSFLNNQYREALNYCGSHSGRDEDKLKNAGLNWNYKLSIPFVDEGNLVLLCQKLSATKINEDSFLAPDIKKWYTDGDMHTMYVAEILEVLAR
ncbi:MAG: flavin reductase [Lachnospiraceae bacterium]|nr:flavin reductase [Lachnospiraceae bacterium]